MVTGQILGLGLSADGFLGVKAMRASARPRGDSLKPQPTKAERERFKLRLGVVVGVIALLLVLWNASRGLDLFVSALFAALFASATVVGVFMLHRQGRSG